MKQIRLFQPTDMFSVIKLASNTLTEIYGSNLFNYFYETFPNLFIVAEKNHKIIGFIIGITTANNNSKILMLAVNKQNRKQKIGTDLIKKFEKQILHYNIDNIELEVRTDNIIAQKFYEKHGFKIVNKIPKFYQDGKNAYTMRK